MQLAQLHMCLHIFKHVDHLSGPGKGWENTQTTGERQHPVRRVERCEAGVGSYQAGSQRRARLRRHHQGAEQQQARRDEVGKNAKNTRAAAVRGTAGAPHGRLTRASWQMQKEFRREAWRGIWRVLGRGGWEGPALGYHQLQSFISQRLTRGRGIDGARRRAPPLWCGDRWDKDAGVNVVIKTGVLGIYCLCAVPQAAALG